MTFSVFMGFVASVMIISMGIVMKVSPLDGWRPIRRYWLLFVIMGLFLLALRVYEFLK